MWNMTKLESKKYRLWPMFSYKFRKLSTPLYPDVTIHTHSYTHTTHVHFHKIITLTILSVVCLISTPRNGVMIRNIFWLRVEWTRDMVRGGVTRYLHIICGLLNQVNFQNTKEISYLVCCELYFVWLHDKNYHSSFFFIFTLSRFKTL